MKMKTKEINNFLIWRNDWPKWKKLKEFLTSDDSPFMSTFMGGGSPDENSSGPSSIKMKPADPETQNKIQASFSNVQLEEVKLNHVFTGQQFDADQIDESVAKSGLDFKGLDKQNAFSRTNKDDKFKIELLLVHPKGAMFRSIAQNISLSGTFSERIVPDEFHHAPFDLIIINNLMTDAKHKRLTLKARVLITDASIYLEYVSPSDEQKAALREILAQYVQVQKNMLA